jgi:hypothetical protein
MINIKYLIDSANPFFSFYDKQRALYNELFIFNSVNDDKKPLSINSTVFEIEEHFKTKNELNTEYDTRKKIAPVWKIALNYWIYEIEKYMLGIGQDEDTINIDYHCALIYDVYVNVTIGKIKYLHEYVDELIYEDENGRAQRRILIDKFLKDIARGVSIAFILPVLKNEVLQIDENLKPVKEKVETLDIQKEKEKLSNRQQILLLHKLGVFDLSRIQKLTDIEKGKLFGHLLNRNEDNTENYIRYRNGKNVDKKYSLYLPRVETKVLELLKELKID